MAFCRLVFPLLVLSVVSCYEAKVPVYIWGDVPLTSIRADPFTTTSPDEFEAILSKELKDQLLTVVFIEETLSVEDFSSKDSGETSYPYLHSNLRNAIYLPSVERALQVLEQSTDLDNVQIIKKETGLSEDIENNKNSIFIHLKDAKVGESRSDLLRRHDEFMQDIVSKLKNSHSNVVAVYTAKYPSWIIAEPPVTHSRVRRAATVTNNTFALNGLRLYAKSISLKSTNESTVLVTLTDDNSSFNDTVGTMNTKLVFENDTSITLNFHKKGGYWFFDTVTLTLTSLTEELNTVDEVFAIEGFSYRCAQHVTFSSVNQTKNYTVSFEDLKIQPYFEPTNSSTVFGDSFNCVGFFTAPIWAGLFVVFILLLITFYGIMMMMDIRTMDRFDDPKGKTITINAAE